MKSILDLENLMASLDPGAGVRSDLQPMVPPLSEQPPIIQRKPAIAPKPQGKAASVAQAAPAAEPQVDVTDYIMKKNALGKYSDENRQKLVDENSKYDLGGNAMAALAALGAGFQGRDSGAAGSAVLARNKAGRDEKLAQFDTGRDQAIKNENIDPMSGRSVAFRKSIEANFPEIAKAYGENWADVSAADQDRIFEPLKLKETIDARKAMAEEQRAERRFLAGMKQQDREDIRNDKKQEKLDQLAVPGYERTGEVMQKPEEAMKFRKATATADQLGRKLDRMKQLVAENGSFEWGGQGGQEMESLATEIQLLGKSPELYELGVLAGPDLTLLEKITSDPSSMKSLFTRDSTRQQQLDTQIGSIRDKLDASSKSMGYKKNTPAAAPEQKLEPSTDWNEQKASRLQELRAKRANGGLR